MKIMKMFSPRRHLCAAKVGTLLVALALIAGTASCAQTDYRALTVTCATGGSVIAPGEGTFTYPVGAMIELVASPSTGYEFAGWADDVGTIADVDAARTSIMMNDNYAITANFVEKYDITAGGWHTVGLKTDGTVMATG